LTLVLTGGQATRLGGVDKGAIWVGRAPMVDHVIGVALPVSGRVLVVGREAGGGPAAAVAATLPAVVGAAEVVVVVAGDLPLLRTEHLEALLLALDEPPPVDAAAALDERGLPNPLVAAHRAATLRRTIADIGQGDRADRLLPPDTRVVQLDADATFSVNTPADLDEARRRVNQ
jgi:molybdopterin-guanine dinucleotide biosynthesis protein A